MARHSAGELLQQLFSQRSQGAIGEDAFLSRKAEILRRSRCRLGAPIQTPAERLAGAIVTAAATRWRLLVVSLTRRVV